MKNKKNGVKLEYVEWFSARGMKRIYAADHYLFGGKRKYSMDIWLEKDGRLLMRFYNRSSEADNYAYEIFGMNPSDIPRNERKPPTWIPDVISKEFDNWMTSEMPFATSMKGYLEAIDRASGAS